MEQKIIPTITVGRYAGVKIDKLPHSYLRWMLTQDFPRLWLDCAKEKLEASNYGDLHLSVSRHAIDMFSKRFLDRWLQLSRTRENDPGLASYIAQLAQEAWEKGQNVSKKRHQDDGIVKEFLGIKFVFSVSKEFPDYKDVITVMDGSEQ